MTNTSVRSAAAQDGRIEVETKDVTNGATNRIDVDHIICATGYRADVNRLKFLEPATVAELETVADAPTLSHHFESSVSGLYFAGIAAAVTFGPLMRFMYGDEFAANRMSKHLAKA
jgi:pyruvate/2-oxoglutarate dehydrogenase complex dihydrolipoamide dehydrogenase (E3) component